jgi:rod shape-determining protein MreD
MNRTPGIRPRPTLWRRLDEAARSCFPAASTILLLVVLAAPLGLPGQAELQPVTVLACVFFWSLFRPTAMSPPVVFLLGVLSDLLNFQPLGIDVLILLVVHGLAVRWRRVLVRQGFLLVWLVYVGVAAGAAALGWVLASSLTLQVLPPGRAIFQAALNAGLYPALATLLARAHRSLAAPEQA